jgi:hypothetical protein
MCHIAWENCQAVIAAALAVRAIAQVSARLTDSSAENQ